MVFKGLSIHIARYFIARVGGGGLTLARQKYLCRNLIG